MSLPDIALPALQLPFEIPVLLHPPLVHFAIVLPVMILILELINMVLKSRATTEMPRGSTVSMLSLFLIILIVIIFFGAYLTGSVDGKNTYDMLCETGKTELKEHKLLGIYLVYGTVALLVFKLISLIAGGAGRSLLVIVSLLFVAVTLKQGRDGGELVYEHGANVATVKVMDDRIFNLEDELETLKAECNDTAEFSTVPTPAVPEVQVPAIPIPAPVAPVPQPQSPEQNRSAIAPDPTNTASPVLPAAVESITPSAQTIAVPPTEANITAPVSVAQ